MRTVDCPACGYGFLMRRGKRCPRCSAVLLRRSEWYVNEEGDRVFLWDGKQWCVLHDPVTPEPR